MGAAVIYATHHVLPYRYGYPYTYGYHPYVVAKPVEAEAEAEAVEAERKKREAEADPEADPFYLNYGYGLHHPLVYTTAPVVKSEVKTVEVKAPAVTYTYHHALPYTYGYHGYPYTYGYYPHIVTKPVEAEAEAVEAERKKREAEADPAVLAAYSRVVSPVATRTYTYGTPYVYGAHPYAHYGYPYSYAVGK